MQIKIKVDVEKGSAQNGQLWNYKAWSKFNLPSKIVCKTSKSDRFADPLLRGKSALEEAIVGVEETKFSDAEGNSELESSRVELEVIGIIRHRILFKTRPKAIISKPQPVVKERSGMPCSVVPNQLG